MDFHDVSNSHCERTPPTANSQICSGSALTVVLANYPGPQICSDLLRVPDGFLEPMVLLGDLLDVFPELQEEIAIDDLVVDFRVDLLVRFVYDELLSQKENNHL